MMIIKETITCGNVAYVYFISTKSHFEKGDNKFQEFIQRTGGSLIQSEAHICKDLVGGASLDDNKSATLDNIITWNFSNDDTAEMPAPKSIVHCAFNQNSTQSCAQLPNKSSMTLTRESVLKRWVSGVWLKVELQQQGCSCTRIH